MFVKIVPNTSGNPPGKLAEAELHFTEGPLEDLMLVGFGIWARRSGSCHNVTFPGRYYNDRSSGARRNFALLRPVSDAAPQKRVREIVLKAYEEYELTETRTGS